MASQLFDPLCFVVPFILPVKRLMQQLCQLEVGWDDPIPEEHLQLWYAWLRTLPELEKVSIPRCVSAHNAKSIDLHCFADASETGYDDSCYVRMETASGFQCAFIMGKSRVSPSKPVTIPRLKLSAAVVAVKLARLITEEMELNIKA